MLLKIRDLALNLLDRVLEATMLLLELSKLFTQTNKRQSESKNTARGKVWWHGVVALVTSAFTTREMIRAFIINDVDLVHDGAIIKTLPQSGIHAQLRHS